MWSRPGICEVVRVRRLCVLLSLVHTVQLTFPEPGCEGGAQRGKVPAGRAIAAAPLPWVQPNAVNMLRGAAARHSPALRSPCPIPRWGAGAWLLIQLGRRHREDPAKTWRNPSGNQLKPAENQRKTRGYAGGTPQVRTRTDTGGIDAPAPKVPGVLGPGAPPGSRAHLRPFFRAKTPNHRAIFVQCENAGVSQTQSGRPDSNWRPPAPKAGALPDCATPRCGTSSRTSAYRPPYQTYTEIPLGTFLGRYEATS
jgi:hypothetical protein